MPEYPSYFHTWHWACWWPRLLGLPWNQDVLNMWVWNYRINYPTLQSGWLFCLLAR